jgi:outer membrane lipoprotein-sorting protein
MKTNMIKVAVMALFTMHCSLFTATAQTAKSVLDKAAANVSAKEGIRANFKMTGSHGNTSGQIAVKGRKFYATTPMATVWFDGKTQWTYMKNNDEVNISNPTEAQLQAINPYNFINLYKKGYNYTLNKSGNDFVVHLTATNANAKIKEMFISINKNNYNPTQVKLLQGKKWTIFDITDLKKQAVADSQFRFNSKDFPSAEVIDLR